MFAGRGVAPAHEPRPPSPTQSRQMGNRCRQHRGVASTAPFCCTVGSKKPRAKETTRGLKSASLKAAGWTRPLPRVEKSPRTWIRSGAGQAGARRGAPYNAPVVCDNTPRRRAVNCHERRREEANKRKGRPESRPSVHAHPRSWPSSSCLPGLPACLAASPQFRKRGRSTDRPRHPGWTHPRQSCA